MRPMEMACHSAARSPSWACSMWLAWNRTPLCGNRDTCLFSQFHPESEAAQFHRNHPHGNCAPAASSTPSVPVLRSVTWLPRLPLPLAPHNAAHHEALFANLHRSIPHNSTYSEIDSASASSTPSPAPQSHAASSAVGRESSASSHPPEQPLQPPEQPPRPQRQ